MAQFIKNRTAYANILAWLDGGALKATLDMHNGILMVSEGVSDNDCGSTMCIAGALAQMSVGVFGKPITEWSSEQLSSLRITVGTELAAHPQGEALDDYAQSDWQVTADTAVQYLDVGIHELPIQLDPGSRGLDLFNPELAPPDCTPAEAAQAVRNFDQFGDPCWGRIFRANRINSHITQ